MVKKRGLFKGSSAGDPLWTTLWCPGAPPGVLHLWWRLGGGRLWHPHKFWGRSPMNKNVLPSGKRLHNYGKIHHFSWEDPLFLWSFSIANCWHNQRVHPPSKKKNKFEVTTGRLTLWRWGVRNLNWFFFVSIHRERCEAAVGYLDQCFDLQLQPLGKPPYWNDKGSNSYVIVT